MATSSASAARSTTTSTPAARSTWPRASGTATPAAARATSWTSCTAWRPRTAPRSRSARPATSSRPSAASRPRSRVAQQTGLERARKAPGLRQPRGRSQPTSRGANALPAASGGPGAASPAANRPLGFPLTLDLDAGMPYLGARGVGREVAAEFGLGLCTTGKTIPGRLGIPIHNADGQVVAYAGRWVGPDKELPEDQGKYQLPAKFHKQGELYNLHRVKGCQTLAIVEGFFGAVRLYGSVSEEQVALLLEHCPTLRFVTVCLDPDDAGRKASELVATRLARHWWVRIATLPDGMQPDTAPEAE